MESSPPYFRIAGIIAIAAALIGIVADICLLYSPEGGYESGDFAFMADVPWSGLIWGHYLGILIIPLEACGIYLVYEGLKPAGKKFALAALLLGIWVMFPGVSFHAATYGLRVPADMPPAEAQHWLETLKPFLEPLGMIFAFGFFILIGMFAWKVLQGKSLFQKKIIFFSPLLTYPLWIASYFALPALGNYLLPAGFNLSMAIFFAAMLLFRKKSATL